MPSIGKDLAKIRSHLGLSIQDIQHYTKIPVSTLKGIETDTIFTHADENQTYIRSFVRSYGRALKIDDEILIKALDQNEAGNYNNLLLQHFPELTQEKKVEPGQKYQETRESYSESEDEKEEEYSSKTDLEPDKESEEFHFGDETEITEEQNSEYDLETESLENHVQEQEQEQNEEPKTTQRTVEQTNIAKGPSVKSVDWADVGRKFSEEKKHTPIWIVGIIIILIVAAFVGYFLYENGFFNLSNLRQQDEQPVATQNETTPSSLSLDIDETENEPEENTDNATTSVPASELDDILYLTVYAAYDGLGPVRVWSDIKPRMDPYWLEHGTAMRFEFRDTIRVRGQYSNILLFKDGNIIENATQQYLQQEEDYIQLTRNLFASDPKWSTEVDIEIPEDVPAPDSVENRPTF